MPYYRRNLYILSCTIFLAAMSWNQVLPFLSLFLQEIGAKGNLFQWVGIVFAAQSVASIMAQPMWGKIGDSVGRKPMILRAGCCLAVIYFLTSLCAHPWQVAVCRFLNGALTGFIPGSMTLIATNTPQKHAARFVATAQAAAAAGLIIGPAIGQWLADVAGYRGSMRISGTLVAVSTLVVWRLVQEPNKIAPSDKTSLLQDFLSSVRSPVMGSVMLTMMIGSMFSAAIGPFLVLYLKKMGCSFGGVVFVLPAAAFVLTARRWTRLGELWGFDRAITLGLVGGAVCSAVLALASNVWGFSVAYFVAGVFTAAFAPAAAAIICTKVDEDFRGRAYGMQSSASMFGALIAPLAASYIAEAFGMPAIFIFVGIVFILGIPVLCLLFRKWGNKNLTSNL